MSCSNQAEAQGSSREPRAEKKSIRMQYMHTIDMATNWSEHVPSTKHTHIYIYIYAFEHDRVDPWITSNPLAYFLPRQRQVRMGQAVWHVSGMWWWLDEVQFGDGIYLRPFAWKSGQVEILHQAGFDELLGSDVLLCYFLIPVLPTACAPLFLRGPHAQVRRWVCSFGSHRP